MSKLADRDELIKILEEHEELRFRFYDVILRHIAHEVYVSSLEEGFTREMLQLHGLYKGEPNKDYDWLYNLIWEEDESVCNARNFVDCRECRNHNNCQKEKQLIQWWEEDMAMNEGGSLD